MKRAAVLLFALITLLLLSIPASAHGGGTDDNGGHYDSSTGEYHYHHGYSAHPHYDMDNDGDIDCPYDFDDQTDHSGSSSTGADSGGSSRMTYSEGWKRGYSIGYDIGEQDALENLEEQVSAAYERGYTAGESNASEAFDEKFQDRIFEANVIAWLVACTVMIFLGVPVVSAFARSRAENRYKEEREVLENRHSEQLQTLQNEISALKQSVVTTENKLQLSEGGLNSERAATVPEGVRLVSSVLPVKGAVSEERPYGDYTVFISARGSRYHCLRGCGSAKRAVHFFTRPDDLEPCRNCVPPEMQPQPLPDWYLQLTDQVPNSADHKPSNPVPPASFKNASQNHTPPAKRHKSQATKVSQVPAVPSPGEMVSVPQSSFVEAVCYKHDGLYVKLRTGGFYWHYNVPRDVYLKLMGAGSVGKFYREHIMDVYPYIPV